MIFFQILLFSVSIVLLSLSVSGYGRLINLKIKNNFFIDIFLGLIIISFIITIIHFFFNISLILSFGVFLIGLIIFLLKQNINFINLIKSEYILSLIIFFLFIPMFLSQKYGYDGKFNKSGKDIIANITLQ